MKVERNFENIRYESFSDSQETWAGRLGCGVEPCIQVGLCAQSGISFRIFSLLLPPGLSCSPDSVRIPVKARGPQVLRPGFKSPACSAPRCLTQVRTSVHLSPKRWVGDVPTLKIKEIRAEVVK